MRLIVLGTVLFLSLGVAGFVLAQSDPQQGEKKQPGVADSADPYNVYATGLFQEVYIDEDFKLYKVRTYQGIVPDRDKLEQNGTAKVETRRGKKTRILRVGFEQRELFSRVFVLADRAISPWIYDNFVQAHSDPSVPFQIFVELTNANVPKTNDRRPLITHSFNTPVSKVESVEIKGGVRVVLTLKRESRYLPVQVGKILYVDVER